MKFLTFDVTDVKVNHIILPLGMVALLKAYFFVTVALEVIAVGEEIIAVPVAEIFEPKNILGVIELEPSPPVIIWCVKGKTYKHFFRL